MVDALTINTSRNAAVCPDKQNKPIKLEYRMRTSKLVLTKKYKSKPLTRIVFCCPSCGFITAVDISKH